MDNPVEMSELILQNTVIAEPVKIVYRSSSCDESDSDDDSDDVDECFEMKISATKTELSNVRTDGM